MVSFARGETTIASAPFYGVSDEEILGEKNYTNNADAVDEDSDRGSGESDIDDDASNNRKVISHIFGRNKRCTSQIPDRFFAVIPRKEYQRARYSANSDWPFEQLRLVRKQTDEMKEWGGVRSWAIQLQPKKRRAIQLEDAQVSRSPTDDGNSPSRQNESRCAERYLTPYLGENKSFDHLYHVLNVIEADLRLRPQGKSEFPGVEFLPDIDDIQYPPKKKQGKSKGKKRVEPEPLLDPNQKEKETDAGPAKRARKSGGRVGARAIGSAREGAQSTEPSSPRLPLLETQM